MIKKILTVTTIGLLGVTTTLGTVKAQNSFLIQNTTNIHNAEIKSDSWLSKEKQNHIKKIKELLKNVKNDDYKKEIEKEGVTLKTLKKIENDLIEKEKAQKNKTSNDKKVSTTNLTPINTSQQAPVNTGEQPVSTTNSSTTKQYSLSQFMFSGVINWGGYKFTYYSQSVLPGGGLVIPGRHVNADGYVSDGDGYIVLAGSAPKGTVYDTPFGYKGKIYDRGTFGNHLDVYIR